MRESYMDSALNLYSAGDVDAAIAEVKAWIKADPSASDAYEYLGEFCKQAGRLDEAIDYAKKLVALDPENVMGYVNLSRYYMLQGDRETAEHWQAQARLKSWKQELAGDKLSS